MPTILDAQIAFRPQRLKTPLRLSSGVIESVTEARASVLVEHNGRRATGQGTIYLSDLWAWPDPALSHDQRDAALRRLCELIAHDLPRRLQHDDSHPLELGLRLHDWACHELPLTPNPSHLARAMCASPFDAAIHDAAGLALQQSALSLYENELPIPSADRYFPGVGACRAIAAVLGPPRATLPAWYIVGHDDRLDLTMAPAVQSHGYQCFKLKITGRDHHADAARTAEVFRKALDCGVAAPQITIDSNEANPSAQSVLDYLDELHAAEPRAYDALQYIEQPTHRDIRSHAYDWRPVTRRKPILVDEGLTGPDMFEEARRQGYAGFALKTCKGHSMLLVAAAWAHQNGMLVALQDLTNPGIALIHAAILGSRLPTINGAELNSPQFTPAANQEFLPRLSKLFEPANGVHQVPNPPPPGLGSTL